METDKFGFPVYPVRSRLERVADHLFLALLTVENPEDAAWYKVGFDFIDDRLDVNKFNQGEQGGFSKS